MFHWTREATANKRGGCAAYAARLEDRVERSAEGVPAGTAVPNDMERVETAELDAHLLQCAACRVALEDAEFATQLMCDRMRSEGSDAAIAAGTEHQLDFFPTRVMARIREESSRRAGIWRPLELLASRFALAAAVALLALSVYLAEFAQPLRVPTMTSSQEIGTGMPEPPAQPASQDEVLTSLAERTNDF